MGKWQIKLPHYFPVNIFRALIYFASLPNRTLLSVTRGHLIGGKHTETLKLTKSRQTAVEKIRGQIYVFVILLALQKQRASFGAQLIKVFAELRGAAIQIMMFTVVVLQQGKDLPLTLKQRCQVWEFTPLGLASSSDIFLFFSCMKPDSL